MRGVRNAAMLIVEGELRANDRRLNEGRMRGSAFARNHTLSINDLIFDLSAKKLI